MATKMVAAWSAVVVLLMGMYCMHNDKVVQHAGHICTPANTVYVDPDMLPWFTVYMYIFDTGRPCYDLSINVKTRYPLTNIKQSYHGLKFRAH